LKSIKKGLTFFKIVQLMRFVFLVSLLFNAAMLSAQEYRFGLYRVEQGLPSDVIKAVAQDSLGFLWIATDDGLVKYDGLHFTTYKGALRSQYAKNFLRTRDGRLLMAGDLDLIEIQNRVDTVIFKTILRGARSITDSTISYPKSIFEDRAGNIWIDEPHAVVRYDGKSIKRFDFGIENRSPVFIRSFSFVEDDAGELFVISFAGKAFRFDETRNRFVLQSKNLPRNCSHALFKYGKLWVAAGDGLYQADVLNKEFVNVKKTLDVNNASFLLFTPDSTLWLSTYNEDLHRLKKNESIWKDVILNYSFNGTNAVYASEEGDVWAATDKGIVLIQKNLFVLADEFSRAKFIEAIAEDKEHHALYYCNKETLVKILPKVSGKEQRKILYYNHEEYFQGLQGSENGLWASNVSSIILFRDDKIARRWEFAKEGEFVHDIYLDSHENLWGSQAGNPNVLMITESLEVKRYKMPTSHQNVINVVREGKRGMYAAASGMDRYLFFKDHKANAFVNISLPVNFQVQGDFNIHDLVALEDTIWLASTEGLLKFDHQKIERVDLGEAFTHLGVGSIEVLDDENILFSNSHGLFRYNVKSKEFWLYDENSGLPSNTITARGIFVNHKKHIWLGTSFGIATELEHIIHDKPTAQPYCTDAQVNGDHVRYRDGVYADYNSFLNFQFSAITFPENKINLQWHLDDDSIWHALENNQLRFTNLPSGNHRVFVRAKKNTGLGWSDTTVLNITIGKPYWQHPSSIFLVVMLVLIIAWSSYEITSRMLNKRRDYLQRLIDERTKDLQKANDELTQRNNELDRFVYSASHDLSAPLKSVLGLIAVSRMEHPGDTQSQYLNMMERSVLKLEEFIRDVVSYSRNTRMEVKYESIDFVAFIKGQLNDQQYAPNFSKIKFEIEDKTNQPFITDMMRLKIVLNNLISNAIKFHQYHGSETPFVKISLDRTSQNFIISVEDNGKGIGASHVEHIFDMFYRATDQAQGSGLGLYILKEAILKMKGTVNVQSAIDKGTTFTITLPVPMQLA
jgi:signal transduction histidine kinase/streptogramin lyase